ncbi:MAG: DNA-deoxyinosine glycosylase, partial [Solibacillus isronensis]
MGPIRNILPPIVDEKTKVLILGSMPGKQSLEKQ